MYHTIPREQIADIIQHLRQLHRGLEAETQAQILAAERREILARSFLTNLFKTSEHPMLSTVLDIADAFSLTLEGAHSIFGYDLEGLRRLDREFNNGRTHIIEDYAFRRDFLVDLPAYFGNDEVFQRDAALKELVKQWQTKVPIRSLQEVEGWQQRGTFYVHVGLEDSLESVIPPGSTAMVEPVSAAEARRPDTRHVYLLQFGNGYCCSRCVAAGPKLVILSSNRTSAGFIEYNFPSEVRVVGRIRFFALPLPAVMMPNLTILPKSRGATAPLILPWEHSTTASLFATKHLRFRRHRNDQIPIRERLERIFQSRFSHRTERRYRRTWASMPHVDTLLRMTVTHLARYSDATGLRKKRFGDRHRYSLESLLAIRSLSDLKQVTVHPPYPEDRWELIRTSYVEWPTLFSLAFPHLKPFEDRIFRLARTRSFIGIKPSIAQGSFVILEPITSRMHLDDDATRTGWNRRIYALWEQTELVCGHVKRVGGNLLLINRDTEIVLTPQRLSALEAVSGIAVPL